MAKTTRKGYNNRTFIKMPDIKVKRFGKYIINYRNLREAASIYSEAFKGNDYKFKTTSKKPFIIDCGSHIGLTILYFKSLYPESNIVGFEPNPENFKILQKNIKDNKLKGVKVYNYAVYDKKGRSKLHASLKKKDPWTWGDTLIYNMWGDKDDDRKIPVKTVALSPFINKPVDLLKIDIEGSEGAVFNEIRKKLHFVREIVFEYHGTSKDIKVNDFQTIKKLLEVNHFRVSTHSKGLQYIWKDFWARRYGGPAIFLVRAVRI